MRKPVREFIFVLDLDHLCLVIHNVRASARPKITTYRNS
jgi:hypothetical protein